jgi:8-oxo-dGTP diphosphatase
VHQGGLWEFPGGKVESGESAFAALCREIREELLLDIQTATPLIKIRHHYADKSVLLDVWRVTGFKGEPHGAEGQPLQWLPIAQLQSISFPVANKKIISALQMPDHLLVTGEFTDQQDFSRKLASALQSGVKLVQLRCKSKCDAETYLAIAQSSKTLCELAGASLLLNSDTELANALAIGLHLNSHDLFNYKERPVAVGSLFSVSCHDLKDLKQAEAIHADFVLLSPVKATSSHPGVDGMGWDVFATLISEINIPAYALGGMSLSDLADARMAGAQGIAAISSFWNCK